jgi:hypothetical protein
LQQLGLGNFAAPDGSGNTSGSANGVGADIAVGTLTITDASLGVTPYTDTYNQAISVALNLKDLASGLTGLFTFTGTLSGTVSHLTAFGNWNSSLAVVWTPTLGGPPQTIATETQTIGGVEYTVQILRNGNYQRPGVPTSVGGTGVQGGYSFHVIAASSRSPTPEPASASLALAGIGSLMTIGFIRRRRARA